MHKVSPSTILGEVGDLQGNFDLGAFDYRTQLSYANPWRYGNPEAEGLQRSRSLSIICPIELFDEETKSRLYEKVFRTVDPICGEVMQDIGGTLQGNWFQGESDPRNPASWDGQLAFVHDNNDPSKLVISIGGFFTDSGKWEFMPLTSGYTNRRFSDVRPDGNIYCYSSAESGRILVQLASPLELSIEHQSETCSDDIQFRNPVIYRR
jgi:hypothetical protein